uniref:Somatostatin/Cortistatin C-terminal domain-containing protein n=1 Tax=Cynoglossus semilaevis TaxID=244447 RepID=A0A3P8WI54_CYNSE
MSFIVSILALLFFASCVVGNTRTEQGVKDLQLQQNSLLWLGKLRDERESSKTWNLFSMEFLKSENGINHQGSRDTEKQEKNRRDVRNGLTTRRAGCRVFFWKSWTSC